MEQQVQAVGKSRVGAGKHGSRCILIQEDVLLLNIVEGGEYLRVDTDAAYSNDIERCWPGHNGVIPIGSHCHVDKFLLVLQGLFYKLHKYLRREADT